MQAKIKRAFNRAAESYDSHCQLQLIAGEKLKTFIQRTETKSYLKILDAGCGTGIVTELFAKTFDFTELHAIDFSENLLAKAKQRLHSYNTQTNLANFEEPTSNHFDLIFSNLALHWSSRLDNTITNLSSMLNSNGLLAFTVPLSGTLQELTPHFLINPFYEEKNILTMLNAKGIEVIKAESETINLPFPNNLSALQSLKHVGVNATSSQHHSSLRGKNFIQSLDLNTLTYHIGFFIIRKLS